MRAIRIRSGDGVRYAAAGVRGAETLSAAPDEIIQIDLEPEERALLSRGLNEWAGPGRCTEELAVAMGFEGVADLHTQIGRNLLPRQDLFPRQVHSDKTSVALDRCVQRGIRVDAGGIVSC